MRMDWISKLFRYLLLASAVFYLILYLIMVYFRIRYPFELEWLEGGHVEYLIRILAGQKIYIKPSMEFIPFIYTPLYFYLSAAVAKLTGIGFFPLRLVSFLASLGSCYLIYALVKKETGNRFTGYLAAGMFMATYRLGGAWFDIARVDTLFLFFMLLALFMVRFGRNWFSHFLAGIIITLAFLTKQTALLLAIPLFIYLITQNRKYGLIFAGTIVFLVGISTLILDYIHQGWYLYYIYTLPGYHYWIKSKLITFWTKDLMAAIPIGFGVAVCYFIFPKDNGSDKSARWFYSLTGLGMLAIAWLGRLNWGNYDNVLLPAYAIIAIMFGLGVQSGLAFIQTHFPEIKNQAKLSICFSLICLIQFGGLLYNPSQQIPTSSDLAAGNKLIQTITQHPGEVYLPYHGYYAQLAGKKSYAHQMMMSDVIENDRGRIGANLKQELLTAIQEQRFSMLILDSGWYQNEIEQSYIKQGPIFDNTRVFYPVTGIHYRRPEWIYLPKGK